MRRFWSQQAPTGQQTLSECMIGQEPCKAILLTALQRRSKSVRLLTVRRSTKDRMKTRWEAVHPMVSGGFQAPRGYDRRPDRHRPKVGDRDCLGRAKRRSSVQVTSVHYWTWSMKRVVVRYLGFELDKHTTTGPQPGQKRTGPAIEIISCSAKFPAALRRERKVQAKRKRRASRIMIEIIAQTDR